MQPASNKSPLGIYPKATLRQTRTTDIAALRCLLHVFSIVAVRLSLDSSQMCVPQWPLVSPTEYKTAALSDPLAETATGKKNPPAKVPRGTTEPSPRHQYR